MPEGSEAQGKTGLGKCIGLVALGVVLGAGGATTVVILTDRMRTKDERAVAIAKKKAGAGATK